MSPIDDGEGFVFATGLCHSCRCLFSFNPHRVPSLRVNGVREPICLACMTAANKLRIERGEPPHPIHPDAYIPIPEGEL